MVLVTSSTMWDDASALDAFLGGSKTRIRTYSDISTARSETADIHEDSPWTKAKVIALNTELLQAYTSPDFQNQLRKLLPNGSDGAHVCVPGRMELAMTVQCGILPKYGLPDSIDGVELMLEIVSPFSADVEVNSIFRAINGALALPISGAADISEEVSELTLGQVLLLGGELQDAFQEDSFQRRLQGMFESGGDSRTILLGRRELAMSVQSKILPKYGLPANDEGVLIMLECIAPHACNFSVVSILNNIDQALGLPAGTTLSAL